MMKATHMNYLHPRHLRAVDGDRVLCVAPSASVYPALAKRPLPVWEGKE